MAKSTAVFVREATGLVRSMTAWDMLFLNFVSFGGAWSIIYALTYVPTYGGNPLVSLLVTAPGILALLGVYYIFQVSMPKSGGDYVFMSRVLHPAIGLASNFAGYSFFLWFWIGEAATIFSSQGLVQTLTVYGSLTGQQWAINVANSFTPMTTFIVGTVALIIFAAIVLLSSRLYFIVQNVSMVIAVLAILVIIGLFATTNPTAFANVLNSYATKQGLQFSQGAYQNVTAAGQSYWGGSVPMDLSSTFTLIPLWFTVLFWVFVSNYLGGETKDTRNSARTALFGSFALIFLTTLAIFAVGYSNLGTDFLAGAGAYASGYATNPFSVLPNMTFFAALLANNPLLVLFIGIGTIAGFLLVAPQCMILMSRILFAYSFDRVAPGFIAHVSEKWLTPDYAILIAAAGGEVFVIFLSGVLGTATASSAFLFYSYAALVAIGFTFIPISIAAIVFPFRRKDLYQTSCPIKRKIAGIPVLTWLGLIALIYSAASVGYYSYNDNFYLGTSLASTYFPFMASIAGLFIVCVIWFYVAKWKRGKEGFPFEKAFKQIPPD